MYQHRFEQTEFVTWKTKLELMMDKEKTKPTCGQKYITSVVIRTTIENEYGKLRKLNSTIAGDRGTIPRRGDALSLHNVMLMCHSLC